MHESFPRCLRVVVLSWMLCSPRCAVGTRCHLTKRGWILRSCENNVTVSLMFSQQTLYSDKLSHVTIIALFSDNFGNKSTLPSQKLIYDPTINTFYKTCKLEKKKIRQTKIDGFYVFLIHNRDIFVDVFSASRRCIYIKGFGYFFKMSIDLH